MKLKNAQHVAFELWCILEDRKKLGESIDGVAKLFDIMRQRHPYLSEALICKGFDLLAAQRFAEFEQRIILRRRMATVYASNPVRL